MPLWSSLIGMAVGIADGVHPDVDGTPSPELREALLEFTRTFPTTPGELSDSGGDVQQSLRRIEAACA
jgi:hypothetical protein